MRARRAVGRARRGASTLAMLAMVLPVLTGGLALSVDLAVIVTARAQLRTVADAAALAGANRLALPLAAGLPVAAGDVAAAQAAAVVAAAANNVLQTPSTLYLNPYNTDTGTEDVVVGYIDPNDPSRRFTTDYSKSILFNAVKVNARRDAVHNGVIPAFFSRILGFQGALAVQSSTAMTQPLGLASLNGSIGVNLLPIVLDLPTYNGMVAGTTTDQYTYNASNNTVTSGPDGITESLLYPVASGSPGNWGTLKVGVNNNSTSTLNSQIVDGISPSQMATYPGGIIQLNPSTGTLVFSANPGISAGIKSSLDQIIGNPVILPIYDPSYGTGGGGNNATYTVVKFAQVRLLATNFQGGNKYVIVQPAFAGSPNPLGTPNAAQDWFSTGAVRVYLTR